MAFLDWGFFLFCSKFIFKLINKILTWTTNIPERKKIVDNGEAHFARLGINNEENSVEGTHLVENWRENSHGSPQEEGKWLEWAWWVRWTPRKSWELEPWRARYCSIFEMGEHGLYKSMGISWRGRVTWAQTGTCGAGSCL